MPTYTIPTRELLPHVDPRNGTMWGCDPITPHEIDSAILSGVIEQRRWNDLVDTLNDEESRNFHINRIATMVRNPPDGIIVLIMENHTDPIRVYLNDGNHRLAAAYVRGDTEITAIVAASAPDSILTIFPNAVLIEN